MAAEIVETEASKIFLVIIFTKVIINYYEKKRI
jgi:hypothetical protein